MGKSTQLQVIGHYLQSKLDRIGELIPSNAGITAQRLARVTLLAINENQALLRCTPESVYAALLESARLGLEIGGPLAQAYLVPYGQKAVFQISYRGLIDLVMRSGSAKDVNVEFVYQGDVFKRELGINGNWVHIASNDADRESRQVTHVYVEFLLPDDRIKRFTMTANEINEHGKRFSKSFHDKEGPWKTNWKSMAAKTVIRQPIVHGMLPVRMAEAEKRVVLADETPATLSDVAVSYGGPEDEIPCDTEGEIVCEVTDEEKAQILAQEAAGEE